MGMLAIGVWPLGVPALYLTILLLHYKDLYYDDSLQITLHKLQCRSTQNARVKEKVQKLAARIKQQQHCEQTFGDVPQQFSSMDDMLRCAAGFIYTMYHPTAFYW